MRNDTKKCQQQIMPENHDTKTRCIVLETGEHINQYQSEQNQYSCTFVLCIIIVLLGINNGYI